MVIWFKLQNLINKIVIKLQRKKILIIIDKNLKGGDFIFPINPKNIHEKSVENMSLKKFKPNYIMVE